MWSPPDALTAIEARCALEGTPTDVTQETNALCGPHCKDTGAGAQGLHVSLGSAGGCVCQATIRRADGTLYKQVPKPRNVGPQHGFLSGAGACFWHWMGAGVFEGEEKLQRKKKNPKNDRQWDSCGLNLVFLLLGCGCINFHKC